MQPYYRYPTQPQHPMQPFQVNPHMYGMNRVPGMNAMPPIPGSVDRFLGTIGNGGVPGGGTNVFTMLTNVQKVLKVAETMGPMIKQYGPAMRNLPSLMTAFKDFQSGGSSKNDDDSTSPDTSNKAEEKEKNQEKKEDNELIKKEKDKKEIKEKVEIKEKKEMAVPQELKSEKKTPQNSKKRSPATKTVPSHPQSNKPRGYHLSGPKLYV
ncbi:VrrA/YqfQ family protein [Fictibacillus barbaricus]|uniref:Outer membrane biosynthesis protein TonB n=1 Tax=Fictibacillus barbaricus TaxID=182136 RepID=A0ABU1TZZ9_9BACL|nr:VrrA/YqfQ family protein [Fictibacillus barbaricus]MDR7072772.1 outer membrane biosynthesis protein TonB [Fictibacillus barbaricus]